MYGVCEETRVFSSMSNRRAEDRVPIRRYHPGLGPPPPAPRPGAGVIGCRGSAMPGVSGVAHPWGQACMSPQPVRVSLGPYVLVRQLTDGRLGERWLALHERSQTSHTLHRFAPCHDKAEQRRLLEAFETLSAFRHGHVLPIGEFSFAGDGRGWLVTPYSGNQEGLVTLADVLEAKGGQLGPYEAERAVAHLLEAFGAAHAVGLHHGPLSIDEVLVDRHGRVMIELFGLARRLQGLDRGNTELIRDEIGSVAQLAYRLLTGLGADEPRIAAGRLNRRLTRAWDEWLEAGLDPSGGFESATAALGALPSARTDGEPREVTVRTVIGRLRSSLLSR